MKITSASRLYLVAIISIAGLLRMTFPGLSEFKADEARLYASSLDFITNLEIPIHGITSSIGIPNFPISTWIYAIPLTLWKHPYSATIFTGLLNTAAIIVCWHITKRFCNTRTALIATILFASSPWAIIFSRKIWAQNTLPLFVGAWALSGLIALHERRKWPTFLHGLLTFCIPQIHFSGLALIPISFINLIICRKQIAWKSLIIGASSAILLAAPLAIHFDNSGSLSILDLINKSSIPTNFESLEYYWMLSIGSDIHSITGPTKYTDFLSSISDYTAVHWFWTILIILGCASLIINSRLQSPAPRMFLSWLIMPLLIQYISPFDVHLHYFIVTFPVQYIVAAIGADQLFNVLKARTFRITGWGLVISSASLQTWATIALLQYVSLHNTPSGFGTPLSMTMNAVNKVQHLYSNTNSSEVLILGLGNDPAIHEYPAIYNALLSHIPHRFVDKRYSNVLPKLPAIVLHHQPVNPQPVHNYYDQLSIAKSYIRLRSGEGTITVSQLLPFAPKTNTYRQFVPPRTLANGVSILGYSTHTTENSLEWEIHWITGERTDADYHFFNHLYNATGEKVGQSDAPSFPAHQWKNGDRVISFFADKFNDQVKQLKVGMYTYPDLENILFVDNSGRPVSSETTGRWPENQ